MNGSATGLISDSPQGQIIGVLNNDQDGLNYPAHKWGTGYYMSNLLDGQAGPWFNNINATPVSPAPNNVYGTVGIQRLQHNLPAVQAFRTSAADAVTQALHDLGQKYNYSASRSRTRSLFKNTGSVPDNPGIQSVPAYLPADQAQYTPVLDDRTGRTDQVSFGVRGIPSLGDIGQYDSSTDPLVGGADNPYPAAYPSKPTLAGEYGQDTNSDYFSNLNFWASGTVHGPGGFDQPVRGAAARRRVHRDVVLVRARLAAGGRRGAEAGPPDRVLRDDAEEADGADDGHASTPASAGRTNGKTNGLTYYWDFGDGSPLVGDDRSDDPAHVPDAGGLARRQAARRRRAHANVGLVPAGRADRLLPDVLPRGRPADRAAAALERPAGGPVRGADAGRAGRDDRRGCDRRTSAAPTATLSDLASWALKPH